MHTCRHAYFCFWRRLLVLWPGKDGTCYLRIRGAALSLLFCTSSANIFLSTPAQFAAIQRKVEKAQETLWNNNQRGCHQACSPRLPALLQPAQVERYLWETPSPPPPYNPAFWTVFQLPRYIWRMASDLEVVSVTADTGQPQWSRMFFRLSDRTLISRAKNFVIWQELAVFQAAAWFLVAAWIWAISWHGGPVQTAGTVRERAAHESRAAWVLSSLGDCMRDSSHLRGSEGELISQTRKKSAAGYSAEPKQ